MLDVHLVKYGKVRAQCQQTVTAFFLFCFSSAVVVCFSSSLLFFQFQFKVDGEWWTWIDYPRFHSLMQRYTNSNGLKTFSTADYMAKTPHWAVYGATEQGFDPEETRYFRKKRKDISGC